MNEMMEMCPSLEFFVDGVELEIQRPGEYEEQKRWYSGKKKMHSVKNLVITDKKKHILVLSESVEGKTHDKKLLDDAHIPWYPDSQAMMDLGFVGYAHPNLQLVMPTKKPYKKDLSEEQKAQNKIVSSIRIGVEHAIGGIKRNHIVHDLFRNHKDGFMDQVMLVSAGLHNLRIDSRT